MPFRPIPVVSRFGAARIHLLALALGAAASLAAGGAGAQTPPPPEGPPPIEGWRPRPVRSGTVSLGGGLNYGFLVGSSRFSEVFNNGLGGGASLRYRSGPEQAFGLSFESHSFAAKSPPDSAAAPASLQFVVTTLDYFHYFNTRRRMPRHIVVGAGLMQSRQKDANDEREFPGDGGVFKLGAGTEYWLTRTLTAELALRYYGVLSQSELTHDFQIALGIHFYTSP